YSLSRNSAVPTSGSGGPDSDARLEQVQWACGRGLPAQTDEPRGAFVRIRVCGPALLLLEKRVQALVTLSRRVVMGFALELGVWVCCFDNLDYRSRAAPESLRER